MDWSDAWYQIPSQPEGLGDTFGSEDKLTPGKMDYDLELFYCWTTILDSIDIKID